MFFTRKITQYNIKKEWTEKITYLYVNKKESPTGGISDELYQTLVDEFSNMNSLFKDRLLQPVDFVGNFYILYQETTKRSKTNLKLYRKNYIQLHRIYKYFNKVDVYMSVMSVMDMEILDEITSKLKSVYYTEKTLNELKTKHFTKIFIYMKIWIWIRRYLLRKNLFELPKIL